MNRKNQADFYNDVIEDVSCKYEVNPAWVKAICMVESAMDPWASRYESHWSYFYMVNDFARKTGVTYKTETVQQMTSWGLMQVMGSVAREHGFTEKLPMLCIPKTGLSFGVKHFRKFYDNYMNLDDAISAYNAGSPRRNDDGFYVNQFYVNKVLENIRNLEAS